MAKLVFRVQSDWEEVVRLRNEIAKLKQELMSMDGTQSPAAFKALNIQLAASNQRLDELVTNAAKAGAEMETGFKRKIFDASQVVNGFTEKILAQKAVVKDIEADVKRLGDAYRIALKRNPLSANSKLEEYNAARKALDEEKAALFGLTQQQAEARLSVKKLRDEYALYNDNAKEIVESNNGIAISWKKALAVIGGAGVLKALGSEMIRVRGEFQSMQTAIETMVGKDMTGQLIPQIKELAKVSPLTMSDMVGAEKMMLGFNIQAEDTIKYLKAISDISMGESTKFNSLTLAFSQMSAAGKLMGQDLNQMINAGFNPLQIISEKTGKSIATLKDEMSKGAISAEMVQQAFIDATSAGGKFYNMSENASKTINGQLSMMQDALDNAFNEMGQKSESVIMKGIQMTTSLIQNYETVGKILAGLVATYGTYRTAVMLVAAAESKHTLVEIGLTNARLLARKAQLALNAAMLTNPYVALTVVIGGLIPTMWAMSDSTTAAARAQKEYNGIKDAALKKEQEHKQKIEELLTAARDESLATLTRQKSLEELRKEYPKIFEQYDIEKLKLEDILKLKQKINEEDSRRSVQGRRDDYNALEQTIANQRRYLQLFDNLDLRKNMSDSDKEIWKMFSGNQSYVQVREQMEKNSELLKKYQKDMLDDNISAYKSNLKNYSKEKLEAELKLAQSSASKRNGFVVNGMMVKGGDLESVISSINGALAKKKSPTTYKQDYEKAKKDWDDAKKKLSEIEKDKSKFTSKQYEEAKKQKETTEKAYKDLGGITGSSLTKQENQAKKEAEKKRKQQEQLAEQLLSLRRKNQQDEINLMADGTEKKLAQIDLDYQKELDAIEKQREEWNKKQKGKLTDEQETQLAESEENAYKKYENNVKDTNKEILDADKKAWQEYFIAFGDYQEKRKAITQKYEDEIADIIKKGGNNGEIASARARQASELSSLDEQYGKSTKAMADLFEDASDKSVNAIQTVIDKYESLVSYLSGGNGVTVEDLKTVGFTDKDLKSIEDGTINIKDITDSIKNLKDTLSGKSPFKKFTEGIKNGISDLKNAKGDTDAIGTGISKIGNAVVEFSGPLKEFSSNIGNIFGFDDSKIQGAIDALEGLGQTAVGVGQIMSGDIVGGAMSAVNGISSVVSALDGMFGADYSHYNAMKEQYDTLNSIWDELIDKKKEYINTSYGVEANKVGNEALELAEKSIESYRILGKERLNSGASAGSHSIGVRIRKGMSKEGWEQAREALGADFDKTTSGRMTGLFDLSAEQVEKLKEADIFWSKLDDDVREYLQGIIDGEERIKDIQKQIKEQLTQVSFDSVFDSFVDMLMDMDSSAEDFSNNFEQYMQRAILTTMVGNKYKDKLRAWYDSFAKANDDKAGITKEEMEKSQAEWDAIVAEALAERNALKDAMGWTGDSTPQQGGSQRGFGTEMTHEDAGELSGRFTALQIAGEEIKVQSIVQSQSLNLLTAKADAILSINTEARNIADDTRDLIARSYLELVQISENTGAIVKPIQQMQKDIADVKKNTSKL